MTEEILTFNEYAAMLKQSRANMYVLINNKEVPEPFYIGGRRYVRKSTIENWLVSKEKQAA